MKTFDEKDLITWSNREKAVIGNEYYFADDLDSVKGKIKKEEVGKLISINDNYVATTFENSGNSYLYACILPVDAVKEEKKYRACRTIQELYELVTNFKSKMSEEECICDLIGTTIHFKGKYQNEFYTMITQIRIINDRHLIGLNGATFSFNELFNNFEIEINGEWKPFGVEA